MIYVILRPHIYGICSTTCLYCKREAGWVLGLVMIADQVEDIQGGLGILDVRSCGITNCSNW